MGLFDRWRRPTHRRYAFGGNDTADRPIVVDRDGHADYVRDNTADNWLWLLLIPLFLLLLLGAYTYLGPNFGTLRTNSKNFVSGLLNRPNRGVNTGNSTAANNGGSDGLKFGVGGAAPTTAPTTAPTQTAPNTTITPTGTGSTGTSQRVQSATDRNIPAVAPATGRGGE